MEGIGEGKQPLPKLANLPAQTQVVFFGSFATLLNATTSFTSHLMDLKLQRLLKMHALPGSRIGHVIEIKVGDWAPWCREMLATYTRWQAEASDIARHATQCNEQGYIRAVIRLLLSTCCGTSTQVQYGSAKLGFPNDVVAEWEIALQAFRSLVV